ncbi:hypothetical protein EUTSA_v10027596mg [Eutrema salsugineum]|uniref:Uncharacterized protein n=1 Tax=Eutrema salsugineum TaxID=72664 RepID=V4P3W4_EUTSA|nr:hypothetical protein EUTSA_v10027596mg [Eutrema salsugineum]
MTRRHTKSESSVSSKSITLLQVPTTNYPPIQPNLALLFNQINIPPLSPTYTEQISFFFFQLKGEKKVSKP